MKKLLIVLAALFTYSHVQAQEEDTTSEMTEKNVHKFYHTPYRTRNSGSFNKNTMLLSLSYGVPNNLYNNDNYFGTSYYNSTDLGLGPIMLRYEFAVHDEIGIAIYGQFATKSFKEYGYDETATGYGGGVMGIYHFNKFIPISKLDVYAGIGVDIHHDQLSTNTARVDNNPSVIVNPIGVIGARYYFSKCFGVFVELGDTGFSFANGGITWRMGGKAHHHKVRKGSEPRKGGLGE